ncbi:RNA 3'-terminal phosphate cyclase [Phanerochaete sordida]|uniref:RNA 3'-terminal-phosphate cyclase (ATP) n=1 Tax=Phanerochaete sordida TaxID=48140 RepID=A0A9P3G2B9_9APHY|nr:RNA 3'-terminal phosphate cyclase [Phanerochaete sordida]
MSSTLIDGSVLEGGGQLVRNAFALSALLQKPITIEKIRGKRKPPGLRAQHAAGLKLVAEICAGELRGAELKSTSVHLTPGAPRAGAYAADPHTAGSTTLLLQIAYPCLLFARGGAPSELRVRGGTNAAHAPQADYAEHVLLPFLRAHFRVDTHLAVRRRGYYPKGGGELCVRVQPVRESLPAIDVTARGAVVAISGKAYVAGYPAEKAELIRAAAQEKLVAAGVDPAIIDIAAVLEKPEDAIGKGCGIVLWADTDTGCRLGGSSTWERGTNLAGLGTSAAAELLRNMEHGGCVDEYLQDQIIIFMVLAKGKSTVRTGPITLHTKTAMFIAEKLTDATFSVQEEADGTCLLSCEGIGYSV